jgi:hypothetical protein
MVETWGFLTCSVVVLCWVLPLADALGASLIVLPKKVRIDGKDYKVVFKKLPKGNLGLFDGMKQEITLSPALKSVDETADTLLHEILHGIEYNNGWDVDETRVRRTATALMAILRDNPEVAEIILGRYKWKQKRLTEG